MATQIGFLIVLTAIAGSATDARAQILNTANIEQLCKTAPPATHRRTFVYVDLSSINKGRTEWGLTIINRLELAPRESVTVLGVNPETFEVSQVFESCYPSLTKAEIEEQRRGRGLWDKMIAADPADQQRENLQTFDARLRNSLDRLIADSAKFTPGKRRNILGALAFDKNRFTERTANYRIIIYTDGVLNDPELEPGADAARQSAVLAAKYPASFLGAEVSVFGVSEPSGGNASLQSREGVFSAFFLNNWAHLKSFSSSLPQQRNDQLPPAVRWEGTFEGGGTQGAARLSFSGPGANRASEIWVSFIVGRNQLYVPFEGQVECNADRCKLSGISTESVPIMAQTPYFRKGDRLNLEGRKDVELVGSLIAQSRETFKDQNQEVRYTLKFAKP